MNPDVAVRDSIYRKYTALGIISGGKIQFAAVFFSYKNASA